MRIFESLNSKCIIIPELYRLNMTNKYCTYVMLSDWHSNIYLDAPTFDWSRSIKSWTPSVEQRARGLFPRWAGARPTSRMRRVPSSSPRRSHRSCSAGALTLLWSLPSNDSSAATGRNLDNSSLLYILAFSSARWQSSTVGPDGFVRWKVAWQLKYPLRTFLKGTLHPKRPYTVPRFRPVPENRKSRRRRFWPEVGCPPPCLWEADYSLASGSCIWSWAGTVPRRWAPGSGSWSPRLSSPRQSWTLAWPSVARQAS